MHRPRALLSVFLFLTLGSVGALAANAGLKFATAAPPTSIGPFAVPARGASAAPSPLPGAAPRSPSPQPLLTPSPVASPGAAIAEVVAVASQTDQKMTLVDPATVKSVREQTAGRTRPWTNDELLALAGGRGQRP